MGISNSNDYLTMFFIVVVIITLASEGVGGLLSRCEGLFQPVTYAACRYYRHAGYAGYSWSNH